MSTIRDITDRRRAEEEVKMAQRQLFERQRRETELIQTQVEELSQQLISQTRLAAIGQMTAMVSHELRNPLGTIRTAMATLATLLNRREEDTQMQRVVGLAQRGITRCDRIIGDLLDFTRIRELELQAVALDAWIAALLEDYHLSDAVTLELDLSCGAEIEMDPERMRQALINALNNAQDSMLSSSDSQHQEPEGAAHLSVSTRLAEARVGILISDTGCGIAAEELEQIFEPLYSTKTFGVGLGLSIIKQIVEQHSGWVEVESELGRGTKIAFWLPFKSAPMRK